jgi:hypothetical protein
VGNQAVVEGHVTRDGEAVPVGYARLLNEGGEFVAEVPLGADGGFRFFAAPGSWTVRVLAPGGVNTDRRVTPVTRPLQRCWPAENAFWRSPLLFICLSGFPHLSVHLSVIFAPYQGEVARAGGSLAGDHLSDEGGPH